MTDKARKTLFWITVNLTPRSVKALELATRLTGCSKTDTVNRALQCYAFLEQARSDGAELLLRRDGVTEQILFM